MHYVIGDVHGCYDQLIEVINTIESKDPDADITLLGDIIDRGPKTWDTVLWAMSHVYTDSRYHMVLGNHEDMVLSWYNDNIASSVEKLSDALPTQYDFWAVAMSEFGDTNDSISVLEPFMRFIKSLPLYRKIKINDVTYLISHASIKYEMQNNEVQIKSSGKYDKEFIIWDRNQVFEGIKNDKNIIAIHGHTPTTCRLYGKNSCRRGMIAYSENTVNLDSGCAYKDVVDDAPCYLSAICLETFEEIYSSTHLNETEMTMYLESNQSNTFDLTYRNKMLKIINGENKNEKRSRRRTNNQETS